jgi:hypothetical protein
LYTYPIAKHLLVPSMLVCLQKQTAYQYHHTSDYYTNCKPKRQNNFYKKNPYYTYIYLNLYIYFNFIFYKMGV